MTGEITTDAPPDLTGRGHPELIRFALLTLLVGILYFLAALPGILWTRDAGSVAVLWPPNAILIAALLNASPRYQASFFAVCFAANMAANLVFETAPLFSASLALANLLEVAVGVYLIKGVAGDGEIFRDVPRFWKAFVLPAAVAPVAGALTGAAAVWHFAEAPYLAVFKTWWTADALGIVVFLPLVLFLTRGAIALQSRNWTISKPSVPAITTIAVLVVAVAVVLTQNDIFIVFILLQATFLWIVLRSGLAGGAQAIAVIGVVLTYCTLKGAGPIGTLEGLSIVEKVLDLQITLVAIALPMLFIGVVLSYERRLVKSLAESEDRYRGLYDKSPVMLHSIGPDGKLVSVSEFWLKKMGYRREEVLGRPSTDFLTENSKSYAVNEVLPRFRREGRVTDIEYSFVTKGGQPFEVLMSAIKDPYAEESAPRSLAVVTDITRQKESERALASTILELERSNDDLRQFAYIASHDLQEPLRTVASYCDLLERRFANELGDEGREFIGFATDGARRMKGLINDLLKYSHASTQEYALKPVHLDRIVEAVKRDLKLLIEERDVQIDCHSLPLVDADEGQIGLVFQNLIHNAIKFNKSAFPKVAISAEPDGLRWRITVSDNGIGIDAKHTARIFEVFQRLHTREEYAGSGIGLAIVKRIVERHDGSISVAGEPGRGASFTFTLGGASDRP